MHPSQTHFVSVFYFIAFDKYSNSKYRILWERCI